MPHAWLDIGPADYAIACLQAFRRQDVRLDAVFILQQGDAAGAIRIVLYRDDGRPDVVLDSLEIDLAVHLLVPAGAKPRTDHTLKVAAAFLLGRSNERF